MAIKSVSYPFVTLVFDAHLIITEAWYFSSLFWLYKKNLLHHDQIYLFHQRKEKLDY